MSNHWHFCLWSVVKGDVSRFLHRLTTTHATSFRRRTSTVGFGHVYQDRFHSSPIFTERHYYNVLRYIEQNPLRAGLVLQARDWRWSSLAERLGNGRGLLDPDPAGIPSDWQEFVEDQLGPSAIKEIRSDLERY